MLQSWSRRWMLSSLIAVVTLLQASSCCCCLGGAVTPPITPVAIDRDEAIEMRDRVQSTKAKTGPFELVLTDTEITSYLVSLAKSGAGDFPARDMRIAFQPDTIEVWATFIDIAPTDLPIYARGTLDAEAGDLVLRIKDVNAGPFSLPGAMRQLVAQSLSETLAELDFDLDIEAVELQPGQVLLRGVITGPIPDLPLHVTN